MNDFILSQTIHFVSFFSSMHTPSTGDTTQVKPFAISCNRVAIYLTHRLTVFTCSLVHSLLFSFSSFLLLFFFILLLSLLLVVFPQHTIGEQELLLTIHLPVTAVPNGSKSRLERTKVFSDRKKITSIVLMCIRVKVKVSRLLPFRGVVSENSSLFSLHISLCLFECTRQHINRQNNNIYRNISHRRLFFLFIVSLIHIVLCA